MLGPSFGNGAFVVRFLLSAVIGLVVVLVAAVLVVPSFIDWNQYKDEIARRAELLTGRELVIGGNVEIALLPAPALVARDVRLANIEGGTAADMVRIAFLEGAPDAENLSKGAEHDRALRVSGGEAGAAADRQRQGERSELGRAGDRGLALLRSHRG